MTNKFKKAAAYLLVAIMVIALLAGCGNKEETVNSITDTIYIGHHYKQEDDPNWVSEITGEGVMDPVKQRAAWAALAIVKEKLGVDIEWKNWPSGVTQDCLQTVLAGDPYCHIAVLSNGFQGRVMVQNVLQPLDQFMDIFEEEDYQWLTLSKTFGHYYLLNRDLLYITDWPIVYNATMLEEIPEFKEADGTTLYPVEMYERGEWTWSKFRWYLESIQRYYAGKKAPSGADIVPFDARYYYTAIQAVHSSGGYIYDGEGMNFTSPEAIEGAEYLSDLIEDGLVDCCVATYGKSNGCGYLQSVEAFTRGECVFNNCARWKMGSSATALAERGESMGIIFFPRPDNVPFKPYDNEVHMDKDYKYNIGISCADSVGLLRGHDKDVSRLALEAYAMYRTEFYKNYGVVDSIAEYRETMAANEAMAFGIDIFHEEIGDKNLEVFKMLGSLSQNEFCEGMNIHEKWGVGIFGKAAFAVPGASKYPIFVKANEKTVVNALNDIQKALEGDGAVDTTVPGVNRADSNIIAFAQGTDPKTVNWGAMFTASDNVDGNYEIKQEEYEGVDAEGKKVKMYGDIMIKPSVVMEDENGEEIEPEFVADRMSIEYAYNETENEDGTISATGIDFDRVGKYDKGVIVKVTDSQGNTKEANYVAYIYDQNGKNAPTLTIKESYGTVALNADTSTIKWADVFVEEAVDENGIDLKTKITADVGELDVTVPGTYPVTIYVTDFAGNRTEQTIPVEVK
ncbi:MAG: hypothetical protein IKU60_05330 [Clostridia bacterium]|nr:hypothetical protein [Clostridia bacterium]